MKRPLEFHDLPFYTQMYIKRLEDKIKNQKDFLTWYTTGNNKHYVGDKLIEAYKKEVLNQ